MWIKREEYERLLDESQRYWSGRLELTQRRAKAAEYIQEIVDLQGEVDSLKRGKSFLPPFITNLDEDDSKKHKHNFKILADNHNMFVFEFVCAGCGSFCRTTRGTLKKALSTGYGLEQAWLILSPNKRSFK